MALTIHLPSGTHVLRGADEQAFIDRCVEQILRRDAARQAMIDLRVHDTLMLELPVQRCNLVGCIHPCGAPLQIEYYGHNPYGYPSRGFMVLMSCPAHGKRYWWPLFGEDR